MFYESDDQQDSIASDVEGLPLWYYSHDTEEEYLADLEEKKRLGVLKMENQLKYGRAIPMRNKQIPERAMKAYYEN